MPDSKRLEDYDDNYEPYPDWSESECQCQGDCECWDIVIMPEAEDDISTKEPVLTLRTPPEAA